MNDLPVAPPSRQAIQAKTASRPKRVTGALRTALDLMIHGDDNGYPLEMDAAAKRANIQTRTLRLAMRKGWVRAYMNQQRAAAITALAANNPAYIGQLRQSTNQQTRLGASRLIEELAGEVETTGTLQRLRPGITIVIGSAPTPARPVDQSRIINATANPAPADGTGDSFDDDDLDDPAP